MIYIKFVSADIMIVGIVSAWFPAGLGYFYSSQNIGPFWGPLSLLRNEYRWQSGRGLKRIAYIHPVPRLKMPKTVSPLPHVYISWQLIKRRDLRWNLTASHRLELRAYKTMALFTMPAVVCAHSLAAGSTSSADR
jgi:hypothetical protein